MSTVDPRLIRSERHVEIGNLLLSNAGIVIERWSQRATQEQPNAQRVHHDVLLDHLTEFLQILGQSLAEAGDLSDSRHWRVAAKHGAQRWDSGWSLPEVIRDYQILRLVIADFLEENLNRSLRHREMLAIGLALDESISASVVVYVHAREENRAISDAERVKELEQVQKRLQTQAAALQESARHKNEFLAVLAHELRNPLAPVHHAVQILRLKNSLDPELQWAREVIERQTQHMARLIDDLSDISRIAHGKFKLEKTTIPIGSVVERAIEEVRPIMDARKHRLTLAMPAEPVWLEADARRLTQVIVNILVNAAKYTNEGGSVHLAVEHQRDELVLKIRDSGIGISADFLRRIFEPFTQAERAEDRVQGGLGIGLALVRNLVDLHGGRVQAFSAGHDAGSEFVVHLPALQAPPSEERAPAKNEPGSSVPSRRILVVDDNRDAANSLAILLKLSGHQVQTAHDGATALEFARTENPEFILLDIGMPRMDGLEVARRIRQEQGSRDVVLIALTGYGQDQDRRRSGEAGFDAHLVKPIELNQLFSLLQPPQAKSWPNDKIECKRSF